MQTIFIRNLNIPSKCHCIMQSSMNNVHGSLRYCCNQIQFCFELSNGEYKYSCGIQKHKLNITNDLNDNERIQRVYKRVGNNLLTNTVEFSEVDMDMQNSNLLKKIYFGPLTEKQYYRCRTKYLKEEWIKENAKFQKRFHKVTLKKLDEEKRQLISTIFHDDETKQLFDITIKDIDEERKCFLQSQKLVHLKYMLYFEALQYLKTLRMYRLPWKFGNDDIMKECSICLESVNNRSEGGYLKCKHSFHHACITSWIKKNRRSCPNCRACFTPTTFLVS